MPPPYKTKWEREWWLGLQSGPPLETRVSFPETYHFILSTALALAAMKGLKFICEVHNDRQSSLQVSLFCCICQYLETSLGNERVAKVFCMTFKNLSSPKTQVLQETHQTAFIRLFWNLSTTAWDIAPEGVTWLRTPLFLMVISLHFFFLIRATSHNCCNSH